MKKVVTGKTTKKVEPPRDTRTKRLPDFLARETGEPRRRFRDFFTDPGNPEVEEPAPVAEAFFVASIGAEPPVAAEAPAPEPPEAGNPEAGNPEAGAAWPGPEHPAYKAALEAADRAIRAAAHAATLQAAAEVRAGLAEAVPDIAEATRLAAVAVVAARHQWARDILDGKPAPEGGAE